MLPCHCLLPLPPPPLYSVLEAVEELETYKAALLYGSADLGLTGSILVWAGRGQAGVWGLQCRLCCAAAAGCCSDCRLCWLQTTALFSKPCSVSKRHPFSHRSLLPALGWWCTRGAVVRHWLPVPQCIAVLPAGPPVLRGHHLWPQPPAQPGMRCTGTRWCCA